MKYQYRRTKEGELLIICVSSSVNGKKCYECLNVYDNIHFDTNKEYLLKETKAERKNQHVTLTGLLIRHNRIAKNAIIVDRLPNL